MLKYSMYQRHILFFQLFKLPLVYIGLDNWTSTEIVNRNHLEKFNLRSSLKTNQTKFHYSKMEVVALLISAWV